MLLWLILPNSAEGRARSVRHPAPDRILWIGAHPDDEALIAPILGQSCTQAPDLCSLLVLTRGERGDCVLPGGCRSDLGSVRATEMAQSADFFHARLTLWTFSDVGTDTQTVDATWSAEAGSHEALIARLQSAILAEKPTAIYTFDPNHGSTCHAAHRELGALVLESVGRMGAAGPRLLLVETAARFVGDGFEFSAATPEAVAIDPGSDWDFLVRDVEIHASQFTPAQVESLRTMARDQRRIYIRLAPPPENAAYTFHCF